MSEIKYAVLLTAVEAAEIEHLVLAAATFLERQADRQEAQHFDTAANLSRNTADQARQTHAMLRTAVDSAKPVEVA